ncbi:putative cation efflux system protein [bacterium HR12]|nr:putative cation efflux system protein [bacterium HR12]
MNGRAHGHPSPAALEGSRSGIRAVKVSLLGLGLTALGQLAVVLLSGSVALLADTVHNAADALTAVPLWVAFALGRRPPSRRYPYGLHRAEDLAGVLIVLAIAASACLAAVESVRRLLDPRPIENLPWVAAAGAVGFLGNEAVAWYRIRVGRRIGSAALVADGLHARTDGLTSLGVLAGAGGAALGFEWADPMAGLAITVAILLVLAQAARGVIRRLLDGTEEATVILLEETAAAVPGVEHVTSARARWTGHVLNAELEIQVDPTLTVEQGHRIAEEVEHALLHRFPHLRGATVHVDPHDHRPPSGPTAHHRRG